MVWVRERMGTWARLRTSGLPSVGPGAIHAAQSSPEATDEEAKLVVRMVELASAVRSLRLP